MKNYYSIRLFVSPISCSEHFIIKSDTSLSKFVQSIFEHFWWGIFCQIFDELLSVPSSVFVGLKMLCLLNSAKTLWFSVVIVSTSVLRMRMDFMIWTQSTSWLNLAKLWTYSCWFLKSSIQIFIFLWLYSAKQRSKLVFQIRLKPS